MVLQHLHCPHIVMAYTVGGYAVFAAQQIRPLYIEFIDVLATVLYLPAV